jgi:hypothetical protein
MSEVDNSVYHTTTSLCNLYRSSHITVVICRMLQWAGLVSERESLDMIIEFWWTMTWKTIKKIKG